MITFGNKDLLVPLLRNIWQTSKTPRALHSCLSADSPEEGFSDGNTRECMTVCT